jgi:hypothetical protein
MKHRSGGINELYLLDTNIFLEYILSRSRMDDFPLLRIPIIKYFKSDIL